MGEWELVNIAGISGYSGYYNYATVKRIADKIGGSVNYASELGYTSISGLWSTTTPPMNLLPVYIPDGSIYGLIFYGGWSSGSPDSRIYFVDLNESGDVESKGSIGGATYVGYNMVAIYTDGDLSVIQTPSGNSYRYWFAFDSCENVKQGTNSLCLIGNTGVILDLENPPDEEWTGNTIYYQSAISGTQIVQNDGALFVELVPHMAYYNNNQRSGNILVCENLKKAIYDYSSRAKIIEVNGVKFQSLVGTRYYIAVE